MFVYKPVFSMTFKNIFSDLNLSTDELNWQNFLNLVKLRKNKLSTLNLVHKCF